MCKSEKNKFHRSWGKNFLEFFRSERTRQQNPTHLEALVNFTFVGNKTSSKLKTSCLRIVIIVVVVVGVVVFIIVIS